ncbi:MULTISPECIES: thiamine-phosphate synthase family protein [Pyrobaculum]|uniref:Phosphomethylpyrimidine kinase n=1 Tax=Pyrobaculum arsenaticum (strain DSM 13514 / JCM 11321 / PZ6) TaxID=340102 RepID=A4WJD3_PYRAR|nr:thiamine-phosphate synthase family protein [Pyrobaculum arsenaticum]ABP50500.1 phosphomethylpyrimidine kinase [Pyrobaculum arsenaticum DSM 13514]
MAAVPGRIVNYLGRARPSGPPTFGASDHVARKILAALKLDPSVRSSINVRYDPSFVEKAKSLGMSIAVVDRRVEFEDVKKREGGSMQWVVEEAFRQRAGATPDVIVDLGDWDKEPMITILGRRLPKS